MKISKAYDEMVDFLATYDPERVLNFHPSPSTQQRVEFLLEKKRQETLDQEEREELAHFHTLEHIIRLAKAKALKSQG